jgi:HlyD family secretion protein
MTEIPHGFNEPSNQSLMTAIPGSNLRLRGNRRSARRLLYVSFIVIAVLFGGFFLWAAVSDISGAVVASGTVKVESSVKKVQNLTGGIIKEIHVKDGDGVSAGDVLIRLDPQAAQSELGIISDQLNAMIARHARLMAERDGEAFDPSALVLDENSKGIAPSLIRHGETELFIARRDALKGQKNVLSERKAQFENQIEGDQAQLETKQKELELIALELKGVESLYAANLASVQRVMPLRREQARSEGDVQVLKAQMAELRGKIDEVTLQITNLDQERFSEVNRDIQDMEPKMAELVHRKAIAQETLKRLEILAPVSGVVAQLNVHTIGGIIQPGETLMQIVPGNEPLTIEALVSPNDIDQVRVGGRARLRLTAFNRRVTPELIGTISMVAADAVRDERSGLSSFAIKIAVPDSEFAKLSEGAVLPGMVAEVYIETATRSVLSYLLKPATDQFAKVFREK